MGSKTAADGDERRYRLDIQGLRGIAVCAVIINHINNEWLPSGYLGVDIFFVISGFVISKTIFEKEDGNPIELLKQFYKRRILRISPAICLYTLVIGIASTVVIPDPRISLKTGIAALAGYSNIFLAKESLNYFSLDTALNPFTQTWSLAVEEQFYLCYPILVLLLIRRSAKKLSHAPGPRLIFILLAALAASTIAFLSTNFSTHPEAYYQTHLRAWEILAGCIGYAISVRFKDRQLDLLSVGTLAMLLGALNVTTVDGRVSTAVCITLTTILLTTNSKECKAYKALGLQPLIHLGRISYSLYLWHWGILSLSRWSIGIHPWSLPLQLGAIYIISLISYKLAEEPFTKIQARCAPEIAFISWITIAGFIASALSAIGYKNKGYLFIGEKNRMGKIYSEEALWSPPRCMNPRGIDISSAMMKNCWVGVERNETTMATKPSKAQAFRIFTIGNSYNEMMVPAYASIQGKIQEIRAIHAYAEGGCLTSTKLSRKGELKKCSKLTKQYLNWFEKQSKPGDLLIISNYLAPFHSSSSEYQFTYDEKDISNSKAFSIYLNELKLIGEHLSKQGKHLIVLSGIPILNQPLDVCVNWYAHFNDRCLTVLNSDANKMVTETNATLKKNIQGVATFVDIYSPISQSIAINPRSIYSDFMNETHLSKAGSLKALPHLTLSINSYRFSHSSNIE